MTTWAVDVGFTYNNTRIAADHYGASYLGEFLDAIHAFAPAREGPLDLLEWGAGLTTLALARNAELLRIGRTLSIDNNKDYAVAVQSHLDPARHQVIFEDLTGPCLSQADKGLNYTTSPLRQARDFDVIYIDGRRRMECAMIALLLGAGDHIVVLHDFRRTRYQVVDAFYDTLSNKGQFRVLRPRQATYHSLDRQVLHAFRTKQPGTPKRP